MTVSVRDARPEDADEVFALARVLARSFTPERAAFDASFTEVVDARDAHVLVADAGGRIVGSLLGFVHPAFFANGRVGWVEEVVVHEDARRQGVGAALMAAFEDRTRRRDGRMVALATTRAGPFYAALGYTDHAAYHRKLL